MTRASRYAMRLRADLILRSDLSAALDARDFFELMQAYRHDGGTGAETFEAVKAYLRDGALPWPSYDEPGGADGEPN